MIGDNIFAVSGFLRIVFGMLLTVQRIYLLTFVMFIVGREIHVYRAGIFLRLSKCNISLIPSLKLRSILKNIRTDRVQL